MRSSVNSDLIF